MKTFTERVIDEHAQLRRKTSKLNEFIMDNPIFLELRNDEKLDLKLQYEVMCKYQDILERRIKRFSEN